MQQQQERPPARNLYVKPHTVRHDEPAGGPVRPVPTVTVPVQSIVCEKHGQRPR